MHLGCDGIFKIITYLLTYITAENIGERILNKISIRCSYDKNLRAYFLLSYSFILPILLSLLQHFLERIRNM